MHGVSFLKEMDDTDRKLMLLIYEDPRMHLRELARRLGITRQAVHHRMRVLTKAGVFRTIKAAISNYYLDGVPVAVWGKSNAASAEETFESLGGSEFTTCVRVAGGNDLFVAGYLRDISELSSYVEFVKKAAEMPEPTVGILCVGDGINPLSFDGGMRKQSHKELSPIDLKIIASLQDDARKPIAEIADAVGVSAKTVRCHLEAMRREGSLDFDSPWDVPSGEDMVTMIYVNLRRGADKVKVARRLLSIDRIHIMYMRQFSNLPCLLLGLIYSNKMTEIRKILGAIEDDEDVLSVTPNLIYFERLYPAWDYRQTAAYQDPSKTFRKHHARHGRITR